jgi:hypothetical protein
MGDFKMADGTEKTLENNELFGKIVKHLNRKKPKINEITHTVRKPLVEIDGCILTCWHNYVYLHILYDKEKVFNPYRISIESQWVSSGQEVGTKLYSDIAPTQEDVIECIRRRL